MLGLLAAGGMGEVYRARDTQLGRLVALKTLPAAFASSPGRLSRLEQEARVLASLNDSRIATLYGLERTDDGVPVLVLELVDGDTLAARLRGGPLRVPEAMKIGADIAGALEVAHAQGILHRDLKPSNIGFTASGQLKLLDFGIATVFSEAGPRLLESDASTEGAPTQSGAIVGTAAYMSPEQARAQELDRRSDVWGFGCVLYEMLAGKRAFSGPTFADTIAAILEQPPDWKALPLATPTPVLRLLKRCLEKDQDRRLRDIRDVRVQLQAVLTDSVELPKTGTPTDIAGPATPGDADARAKTPKRRAAVRRALTVILAGVALLAVGGLWRRRTATPLSERVPHAVPFTTFAGREYDPAFSPHGESLAFAWDGDAGNFDIYVKQIGSESMLRLTSDRAQECCPAWSPDGNTIAFAREGADAGIFTVPALGGRERRVAAVKTWFGLSLTFSPDGRRLAFTDRRSDSEPFAIYESDLDTLETRRLTDPPRGVVGDGLPAYAPAGDTLAFARMADLSSSHIELRHGDGSVAPATPEAYPLGGLAWAAGGRALVFASSRSGPPWLSLVELPGGRVRTLTRGDAPPLSTRSAESLSVVSRALRIAVSRDGKRIAYPYGRYDTNIWRVSAASSGTRPAPQMVFSSTRMESGPAYSPDGGRVAFASTRSSDDDRPQIWVCEADGTACTQLTRGAEPSGSPRFSPDGRSISFDSGPAGRADVYVVDLDSHVTRRITTEDSDDCVPSWSAGGRSIYFASNRDGSWQVWKTDLTGSHPVRVTTDGGFAAQESPDGRFLYYAKFGMPGLWRLAKEGGRPTLVTDRVQCWGHWTVGRQGLYFADQAEYARGQLSLLDMGTGRISALEALRGEAACGEPGLALSPDERWILYVQADEQPSDLMLLEGFE
ncbi:MAG TPA: protein kinase [Vicinamibacteria bacterium]